MTNLMDFYIADTSGWECEICEIVVDLGITALKDNTTTSGVDEQIDNACSEILPNDVATCEEVADNIVSVAIKLLDENVTPSAVCTVLSYC